MNYTKTDLCDSYGLIKVCQVNDGDLCGFKGILMRYVRRFVLDLCQPAFQSWLTGNAWLALNNRDEQGLTSSSWLTKSTPEVTGNAFSCSSAVSAGVNAPLGDVVKDGFTPLQAEAFDYHRGVFSIEDDSRESGRIIQVSKGVWTQYDNVDFGNQTAKSISVEVTTPPTNSNATISVYFDKIEGEPAGIIELKELDPEATWHTVRADITPTTGQHHLYLQFSLVTSRAKAFSVDQFTFQTDTVDGVQELGDRSIDMSTSYFDLNGRRLSIQPMHGAFLVRQGSDSHVIIK